MHDPDWSKENTMKRLNDPEVGDQFCEMCSFWVTVVDVAGDDMVVFWGKKLLKMKKDEFFTKCCYSGKTDSSWLRYYGKCKPDLLETLRQCVDEAEEERPEEKDLEIFLDLKFKGVKEAFDIAAENGDFVVVKTPKYMTAIENQSVAKALHQVVPEGVQAVILHEDMEVKVSKINPVILHDLVLSCMDVNYPRLKTVGLHLATERSRHDRPVDGGLPDRFRRPSIGRLNETGR